MLSRDRSIDDPTKILPLPELQKVLEDPDLDEGLRVLCMLLYVAGAVWVRRLASAGRGPTPVLWGKRVGRAPGFTTSSIGMGSREFGSVLMFYGMGRD